MSAMEPDEGVEPGEERPQPTQDEGAAERPAQQDQPPPDRERPAGP
jgi:hypothetical protein